MPNNKDLINYYYPTLLNSYKREYYRSINNNIRLTLDSHQIFYRISHKGYIYKKANKINTIIMELKFDYDTLESDINFITQNIPFRITKNSKYINGIDILLFN